MQIKFESYGPKQGPLHGLPISTPYLTKDYLQQKRFQAQSNGTTYCYDIPDMFRQVTERLWKEYLKSRPTLDIPIPQKVLLDCFELVLNGDQLEEVKRLPGENDVSGQKEGRTREESSLINRLNPFSVPWLRGD